MHRCPLLPWSRSKKNKKQAKKMGEVTDADARRTAKTTRMRIFEAGIFCVTPSSVAVTFLQMFAGHVLLIVKRDSFYI